MLACWVRQKLRSPGGWEEGRERQRQVAQEGGHAGEGGLHLRAATRWGRGLECGEGPTENKAEPGPARKASCH